MGHLKSLLSCLVLIGTGTGQNWDSLASVAFLRSEVRRLCRFEGRGFQGKGYQKAARYLRRRLTQMGYAVGVDTFRHTVRYVEKARIWPEKGPAWTPGIDYWPNPAGPSLRGSFEVDTLPKPGRIWLIPETLSLRTAFEVGLRNEVAALLRPVKKVNAHYAQEAFPLMMIETTQKPPAGTTLHIYIQTTRAEVENYNIIAEKPGKSDSLWIIGAHYDHLGRAGRSVFWGANDNASGVAFLLLLAQRLREKTLPYRVVFVAFGAEEVGLLGSYYFVGRHNDWLMQLKGMLNFDLMGFGEKGFAVVGASDQPDFWEKVSRHRPAVLAEAPQLLRPNAPNSDHYPFREKGYPALFFYLMGGPGYYHDPLDRPQTLSWHGAYALVQWVEAILSAGP